MATIDEARRNLDQLDIRLLEILAERRDIVQQIGKEKAKIGLPVLDAQREKAQLSRILTTADQHHLNRHFVAEIFQQIILFGRQTQESIIEELE